jgi:hypothetical protein
MTTALSGVGVPDVYGFTTADLHALPEDGRRCELIVGRTDFPAGTSPDAQDEEQWRRYAITVG